MTRNYLTNILPAAALSLMILPGTFSLSWGQDKGASEFIACAACHGMDGKGNFPVPPGMAPNFHVSEILKGEPEAMVAILMRGIKKQNPAEYMGQMMLPLGAAQTDEWMANVINYVRIKFGGVKDSAVTPAQVAEWRKKYPQTPNPMDGMLTREDIAKIGKKQ